jgi:hypothetical protein
MTGECWLWCGALDKDGYGTLNLPGSPTRKIKAHRYSFLLHNGPFDERLMVLHRCDVTSCVHPDHLFLGDAKINAHDMANKRRGRKQLVTACPAGHPYNDENTYHRIDKGPMCRQCRACDRERKRKARAS